jgi:DME family drug/metabolite transporter
LGPTENRLLGALAVAAAATMWGTLGIFAKILYAQGVSFESLVAVRASVGWLAVIGFLLATRGARDLRVERRDLAFLLPLGLVGIGAFYLLYFYTVRESTVGTAAILLYSAPAFVVVLAWLFLREPLNA